MDLSLITTKELTKELTQRFDVSLFVGIKAPYKGPNTNELTVTYPRGQADTAATLGLRAALIISPEVRRLLE